MKVAARYLHSIPVIAALSALLTACSGAPSESELTATVQAQTRAEREATERLLGKRGAEMSRQMHGEFKGLKKIGCKADGERAFRCDVELEVQRGEKVIKAPANFRVVKGSEGWAISR